MKNLICVFDFVVIEDIEIVRTNSVAVTLNEDQVQEYASLLKEKDDSFLANDLPLKFQRPIIKAAIETYAEPLEKEGIDIEEASFCLSGELPVNLRLICDKINGVDNISYDYSFDPMKAYNDGMVDADIKYKVQHGEEFHEEVCPYGLSKTILDAMVNLAWEKPSGISDFDYMKEKAPEMYDFVYTDICDWSNNLHLREWRKCEPVFLADFPEVIFEQ